MCESIENLIEVTNNNIKSELEKIQEYITKISNDTKIGYENINEVEYSIDDLNQPLKIIKRLKLLKNKLNRIKSEIRSLKMFPYKPEIIDTDDESEWEKEEQQLLNISYCKLECESESEGD